MITFDGWSGAGKTTQAKLLAERLGIPSIRWLAYLRKHKSSPGELGYVFDTLSSIILRGDDPNLSGGRYIVDLHFQGLLEYLWDKDENEREVLVPFFVSSCVIDWVTNRSIPSTFILRFLLQWLGRVQEKVSRLKIILITGGSSVEMRSYLNWLIIFNVKSRISMC